MLSAEILSISSKKNKININRIRSLPLITKTIPPFPLKLRKLLSSNITIFLFAIAYRAPVSFLLLFYYPSKLLQWFCFLGCYYIKSLVNSSTGEPSCCLFQSPIPAHAFVYYVFLVLPYFPSEF